MKTDRLIFLLLLMSFFTVQVYANVRVPARDISVNASMFGNNLTNADTDVQKALDTIDDMIVTSGGGQCFTVDGDGDFMPGGTCTGDAYFELDGDSDIMPKQ